MKPGTESKTAPLAVIGVDIGKEVFHLVGLGVDGKTAFRRRIRRLRPKARGREPAGTLAPETNSMLSAAAQTKG